MGGGPEGGGGGGGGNIRRRTGASEPLAQSEAKSASESSSPVSELEVTAHNLRQLNRYCTVTAHSPNHRNTGAVDWGLEWPLQAAFRTDHLSEKHGSCGAPESPQIGACQ